MEAGVPYSASWKQAVANWLCAVPGISSMTLCHVIKELSHTAILDMPQHLDSRTALIDFLHWTPGLGFYVGIWDTRENEMQGNRSWEAIFSNTTCSPLCQCFSCCLWRSSMLLRQICEGVQGERLIRGCGVYCFHHWSIPQLELWLGECFCH